MFVLAGLAFVTHRAMRPATVEQLFLKDGGHFSVRGNLVWQWLAQELVARLR